MVASGLDPKGSDHKEISKIKFAAFGFPCGYWVSHRVERGPEDSPVATEWAWRWSDRPGKKGDNADGKIHGWACLYTLKNGPRFDGEVSIFVLW